MCGVDNGGQCKEESEALESGSQKVSGVAVLCSTTTVRTEF